MSEAVKQEQSIQIKDPIWNKWGGNDRQRAQGRRENKKLKLRRGGREKMRCWQKNNNLMDKHLWVRGTMGNIYCTTSHFSLAQPVNLRGKLRSWKEEWDRGVKVKMEIILKDGYLVFTWCIFAAFYHCLTLRNECLFKSHLPKLLCWGLYLQNREPNLLQRVGNAQQPTKHQGKLSNALDAMTGGCHKSQQRANW